MFLAAVALAALAAPAQAAAQPAPSAVPAVAPQSLAKARRLVALVNPFDKVLDANLDGWEGAARKSLALEPGMAALEKNYPGIGAATIAAARPLARKYLTEFVKTSAEYKADLLTRRLTDAELDEAGGFFDSPAGRKAIAGLFNNADPARIGADLAVRHSQTGEAVATEDDVRKVAERAASGMLAEVSAADQAAIIGFSQSPVGKKFTAATRESDVRILDMANHPSAEWLEQQGEAMRSAALAFMKAAKN